MIALAILNTVSSLTTGPRIASWRRHCSSRSESSRHKLNSRSERVFMRYQIRLRKSSMTWSSISTTLSAWLWLQPFMGFTSFLLISRPGKACFASLARSRSLGTASQRRRSTLSTLPTDTPGRRRQPVGAKKRTVPLLDCAKEVRG